MRTSSFLFLLTILFVCCYHAYSQDHYSIHTETVVTVADTLLQDAETVYYFNGTTAIKTFDGKLTLINLKDPSVSKTIGSTSGSASFVANAAAMLYFPNSFENRKNRNRLIVVDLHSANADTLAVYHRPANAQLIFPENSRIYAACARPPGFHRTADKKAFKAKTFNRYSSKEPLIYYTTDGKFRPIRSSHLLNTAYPDNSFVPYKEEIVAASFRNHVIAGTEADYRLFAFKQDNSLRLFGQLGKADNSSNFPLVSVTSPREWLINEARYDLETVTYGPVFFDSLHQKIYRFYQPAIQNPITPDSSYANLINQPDFFDLELCLPYPDYMKEQFNLAKSRAWYLQVYDARTFDLISDELAVPESGHCLEPYAIQDGRILCRRYKRYLEKPSNMYDFSILSIEFIVAE